MGRKKEGPHIFRRKDRQGFYGYIDRINRAIALGTEDETEALKRLNEVIQSKRFQEPAGKTLAQIAATAYERSKVENTKSTSNSFHGKMAKILELLEADSVLFAAQITESSVKALISRRKTELGAASTNPHATINRELDCLVKTLKVAASPDYKLIDPSMLDVVRACKLREPKPAPHQIGLTRKEILKWLKFVEPKYVNMFRTILGSGLRNDEMVHLDDSDITDISITVTPKQGWTTKNYRYRTIPATKETVEAARAFVKARNAGLNIEAKTVWNVIQFGCLRAGIKQFSIHYLRKLYASALLSSGVKIAVISKLLGHADIVTTMRYLLIDETDMPEVSKLPW